MKKKFQLIKPLLSLLVLFSILLQYAHGFEHFTEEISTAVCHHKKTSKHEITHQHESIDHCAICELNFPNFSTSISEFKEIIVRQLQSDIIFFFPQNNINYFKGSLFQLRAPPIFK